MAITKNRTDKMYPSFYESLCFSFIILPTNITNNIYVINWFFLMFLHEMIM